MNSIKKLYEKINWKEFSFLKVIFIENKIDIEEQRVIDSESINGFVNENKIENKMQISIKDGTGFEELIEKMDKFVNNNENDIPINYIAQDINETTIANLSLDKSFTFILIGNSNAGKTCFFHRFNNNQFQENFLSTVGMDKYLKYFTYKGEKCKITIWDTAGQDRYRSLPRSYYQNADGIFLFFDVTNQESFNDVTVWMNEINNYTKSNIVGEKNEKERKIKIYLIGNKIDLLERCVTKEEAEDKAIFFGIKYFEVSCKLNMNINEVSARMINDCFIKYINKNDKEKQEESERKKGSFSLERSSLKKKSSKQKSGCC